MRREPEILLEETPSGGSPYLVGNFAPVGEEHDTIADLAVTGTLPPDLDGLLLRNGPNPAVVSDPLQHHWFMGDGMVHAIRLGGGRAHWYRNRWVQTRRLADEIGTPEPPGPAEAVNGPANTHVVCHGGRILALVESGLPHQLDSRLRTRGLWDFGGMLTSPMTAHPKVDPVTGGMAFFGYDVFGPPFLRYHEAAADGTLVHSTEVPIPRATMQHDFAVSERQVAFLDLPVVFDPDLAIAGQTLPFAWDPAGAARVGVLQRGGRGPDVRWAEVERCYAFHVLNAYDGDGDTMVLDLCRYDRAFDTAPGGLISSTLPVLERWVVDPVAATVDVTRLDDRPVELPRLSPERAGRPHRFGYCVLLARDPETTVPQGLVRYDLRDGRATTFDPGPGRFPGEPVFVPAAGAHAEDEGWVLTMIYDAGRDQSDLVVLDATRFGGPPQAVIHLPVRVPFGFHGSWLPAGTW